MGGAELPPFGMSSLRQLSSMIEKAKSVGATNAVRELSRRRWNLLLNSTLSDLEEAGICVPVKSSVLGEVVWFASDNSFREVAESEGVVLYTVDELRLLKGMSRDELVALHEVKKKFSGVVVDRQMPKSSRVVATVESSDQLSTSTVAEFEGESEIPDVTLRAERAAAALDRLAAEVRRCAACSLHMWRTNAVPGEGNPAARVVFVGEAPGAQEDRTGRPFVGQAGRVLNELLGSIGLKRSDVYIANVIKCRPVSFDGRNRQPTRAEVDACRGYLKRQLMLIRPKLVVALGNTSLEWFFPESNIGKMRGKVHVSGPFRVYPTYHPAAVLYREELRPVLESDFRAIPRIVEFEQLTLGM